MYVLLFKDRVEKSATRISYMECLANERTHFINEVFALFGRSTVFDWGKGAITLSGKISDLISDRIMICTIFIMFFFNHKLNF